MKPSTRRCLLALRAANGWVSGNVLFQACGTRYGGRVFELRHDFGFTIERRSVRGTAVDEYMLVEQLELGGGVLVLRRYTPLKPSRGTMIRPALRAYVYARDNGCVLRYAWPHVCAGGIELDHVRASRGIGMKSPSTADNLVSLCSAGHRYRTEHGKLMRPLLLAYLERVEGGDAV